MVIVVITKSWIPWLPSFLRIEEAMITTCPMHRFTRDETRKFTCAPHAEASFYAGRNDHWQNPRFRGTFYPGCDLYYGENLSDSMAHSTTFLVSGRLMKRRINRRLSNAIDYMTVRHSFHDFLSSNWLFEHDFLQKLRLQNSLHHWRDYVNKLGLIFDIFFQQSVLGFHFV